MPKPKQRRAPKLHRDKCTVCDQFRLCENHHPIPSRVGGTFTIPLCRACHDELDRQGVADWGMGESYRRFMRLWDQLDADGRIAALKMVSLVEDARSALAEAKPS